VGSNPTYRSNPHRPAHIVVMQDRYLSSENRPESSIAQEIGDKRWLFEMYADVALIGRGPDL
jgi:hypothetical protein